MKNYWKERLVSEYGILRDQWELLSSNWKKESEDNENLYRFRVPLNITAFLCRRLMEQTYIAYNENKKYENKYKEIKVRILKSSSDSKPFYEETDSMQYGQTFENKTEAYEELYEICNYIIHEYGSMYADDMISWDKDAVEFRKSAEDTAFFYDIETYNLRKRSNHPERISWFVQWSSEKPGKVLIDIKSLMLAFDKFINLY